MLTIINDLFPRFSQFEATFSHGSAAVMLFHSPQRVGDENDPTRVESWLATPGKSMSHELYYVLLLYPICSMYGIFTNINPQNHPNVGKYTIHGAYGYYIVK